MMTTLRTLMLTALTMLACASIIHASHRHPTKPDLGLVAARFGKGTVPKPKLLDVPAVVDARISNLSDRDHTVRCCGITALGLIGPEAIKAVPALLQALCDSNPRVQTAAALALHRIDPATFEEAWMLSLARPE